MASTSSAAFTLFIRSFFAPSESCEQSGADSVQLVKLVFTSHHFSVHPHRKRALFLRFESKRFDNSLHKGITGRQAFLLGDREGKCGDAINIQRDTTGVFINRQAGRKSQIHLRLGKLGQFHGQRQIWFENTLPRG